MIHPYDRYGKLQARPRTLAVAAPHIHPIPGALLTALLALVAAAVLAGCGGDANDARGAAATEAEGRVIRVETLILEPTTFEDVVQITGTVSAIDDAMLSAQQSGTVTSLARLGTVLPAGGTVAQLDPTMARAAVEQAEAAVESAQALHDLAEDNMQRNEPLYQDSVISAIEWENVRSQYNQARAGLSQARAALSQAQEQLRQTRVTSPFRGTVESHLVEIGEQVMPGTPVARIINTSRVKVVAGVPERYAADIRIGTPVSVHFRAYAGAAVQSEVSFVGRAIDPQNRTFPVEILIENPTGTIKPEMIAQVHVVREAIENALVVPRAAVVRDEQGNSVFLVQREGDRTVAAKTPVTLGSSYGGNVVVTNLRAGDEVVVLGQSSLTEGDRVQVMDQYSSPDAPGISVQFDSSAVDG